MQRFTKELAAHVKGLTTHQRHMKGGRLLISSVDKVRRLTDLVEDAKQRMALAVRLAEDDSSLTSYELKEHVFEFIVWLESFQQVMEAEFIEIA